MTKEHKNLIFQFIEELNSERMEKEGRENKEEEIYKELEIIEKENPLLKKEISKIINMISMLYSNIKYKYFEYGIMAKTTEEETNLNWKG